MEGGVAIINDVGGGRLGSAARSTSSTSKRKLIKSGYFGPEQYIIATPCHPFIIAIWT